MKTSSSPERGEVDERGHERRARDSLVLLRRHVREHGREQRAAEAIAERVDLLLAGRLLDRVERRERAFDQVVLEVLVRELGVGVHPRDDEHRHPLLDRPLDQRVLFAQVEDVVLVDPRRHDEQRPLRHLLRRRLVLDQLHQVVLEDDLAGRGRDVDAELEGLGVGHRDLELAVAALDVVEQVVEALDEVLARPSRSSRGTPRGWSARNSTARARRCTGA